MSWLLVQYKLITTNLIPCGAHDHGRTYGNSANYEGLQVLHCRVHENYAVYEGLEALHCRIHEDNAFHERSTALHSKTHAN